MPEAVLEGRGARELCDERHNERSEETRSRLRQLARSRKADTYLRKRKKSPKSIRMRDDDAHDMAIDMGASRWLILHQQKFSAKTRIWTQRSRLLKQAFTFWRQGGKRAIDF